MRKTNPMIDKAFLDAVWLELGKARRKFPSPEASVVAAMEEAGEVAKAMLDESKERVYAECVQLAALALRIAVEGDPTLDAYRARTNADTQN